MTRLGLVSSVKTVKGLWPLGALPARAHRAGGPLSWLRSGALVFPAGRLAEPHLPVPAGMVENNIACHVIQEGCLQTYCLH